MVYKPTYIWGAPSCITEFNSANNGIQLVNDNQFKGNMLILGTMTCFFPCLGGWARYMKNELALGYSTTI